MNYVRGCKVNHEYFKGLWCKGNTSDFGPDIPSSNLGRPTKNFEMFLRKTEMKIYNF